MQCSRDHQADDFVLVGDIMDKTPRFRAIDAIDVDAGVIYTMTFHRECPECGREEFFEASFTDADIDKVRDIYLRRVS